MNAPFLIIHPKDNVGVALQDLPAGTRLALTEDGLTLPEVIPAKHKFTLEAIAQGEQVFMYGVLVGKATKPIAKGGRITTENLVHAAEDFNMAERSTDWVQPDLSRFTGRHFKGFHREDGRVGTRNFWLVVPLVFLVP